MKNFITLSLALIYTVYFQAQQLPNRYLDEITNSVSVTNDVVFSTNIPTVRTTNLFGNRLANENSYGEISTTLRMDIYTPQGDNLTQKPVIIFAFGGGFVNGNRREQSMVQLCEAFARRGFVAATIDYRLGMNLTSPNLSQRAVYRALQDGRSAVRFFRKNANTYNIDPNSIFLSGHSAGAFIAYQGVYLDKDSERPASTREYFGRADLGGLDDIGDNQTYTNGSRVSGKANGAMGFAGAIGELSYIEDANDAPSVYFHSSDDGTVPFNTGRPFPGLNILPGIDLPVVQGSNAMNTRANNVNAPHTFYPYDNRGHRVHQDGSNLYPEIAPNGSQFFYDNFFKPSNAEIIGDREVCSNCNSQTYTAENTNAVYYDWQITGGTFIQRNPNNNTVVVKWDVNASNRNLTVTPYSQKLARGTSTSIFPRTDNCAYDLKPGLAIDIAARHNEVYVVGTNNRVYRYNGRNYDIAPDIGVNRIAVDQNGQPWVLTTINNIYKLVNNRWQQVRGKAKDIGITDSHIYVVGNNNSTYKYNQASNRWTRFRGRSIRRIDAAANGDAWAVGSDNYVYQLQNGSWTSRKGNFRASDITISKNSNTVWAVEFGTGIPHKYLGNGIWERFRGILANISTDETGVIWGSNSNNNIYSNNCPSNITGGSPISSAKLITVNKSIVSFYPNPATEWININTRNDDSSVKTANASIINFNGQIVKKESFKDETKINVSDLSKGIYVLKIEVNNKTYNHKIVIN